ncbi:T9SS type A sorting domain-containing protein [Flavobacteriales bacterium]|nr:T9SS type A sorting domain-containing protein [Flavobacteriales bacterium]
MKKFQIIILLASLSLLCNNGFSQQIVRSSLSSFGNFHFQDGTTFRQTVGQASSTSVLNSEGISIQQGFQQPVHRDISLELKKCVLHLSPNPSNGNVSIEIMEDIGDYNIAVVGSKGSIILNEKKTNNSTLNLTGFSTGVYIIRINSDSGYFCNQKLIIIN